ncbi:MAG TPA: hypothetical protein VFQ61_32940, partial [Polyangiaceae bacterium]|nr:hypothetical protein [Polyangiaceae bacterium]
SRPLRSSQRWRGVFPREVSGLSPQNHVREARPTSTLAQSYCPYFTLETAPAPSAGLHSEATRKQSRPADFAAESARAARASTRSSALKPRVLSQAGFTIHSSSPRSYCCTRVKSRRERRGG